MKMLVFTALVLVLAMFTSGRVVTKEEEEREHQLERERELLWRDESEVPKSCWKFYFECLSGCVMNDEEDRSSFWCLEFCGTQREMCQRDSVGYWDVDEEKKTTTVDDLRRKY